MDVFKTTQTQQKVDMICDICGRSCKDLGFGIDIEHATLFADWGFGSIYDQEQHRCDICPVCYDRVVAFIKSLGGHIQIDSYKTTGLEE
jgi:hypothetical protein